MSTNVYQLIAKVTEALSKEGIGKTRKNQQQGFSFRGIDDVYNALAPVLAKEGLVILPRCLSRELTERSNKSGGVIFSVTIDVEFDFVSSHDGSKHTVKTYGEAMDSADKATNKAMSAAYKYAAFQTFCIPTEGDNDADGDTHDLGGKDTKGAGAPIDKAASSAAMFAAIDAADNLENLALVWQEISQKNAAANAIGLQEELRKAANKRRDQIKKSKSPVPQGAPA